MSDTTSQTTAPPNRKRFLGRAIRGAVTALVVLAFFWTARKATAELAATPYDWETVEWSKLPLAGLLYALVLGCGARMWHRVLSSMGVAIPFLRAALAFAASQLAKYVPGKALVLVVRCGLLCTRSPEESTAGSASPRLGPVIASSFVETLMWVLVGAQVGCIGLLFRPGISWQLFWGSVGVMVMFGVLTLPPIFTRGISFAAKLKRAKNWEESRFHLSWPTYIQAWGWSLFGWLIYGAAMYIVIDAVAPQPLDWSHYLLALTTICLASVGGFISMLPGGLGVRELVMIPLLAGTFSTPLALISAILMRLICIAVELLLTLLAYGISRARA